MFSPYFYHILRDILELLDKNYAQIGQDIDEEMLINPDRAIESVGDGILKRCYQFSSIYNKSNNDNRSIYMFSLYTTPQLIVILNRPNWLPVGLLTGFVFLWLLLYPFALCIREHVYHSLFTHKNQNQ